MISNLCISDGIPKQPQLPHEHVKQLKESRPDYTIVRDPYASGRGTVYTSGRDTSYTSGIHTGYGGGCYGVGCGSGGGCGGGGCGGGS